MAAPETAPPTSNAAEAPSAPPTQGAAKPRELPIAPEGSENVLGNAPPKPDRDRDGPRIDPEKRARWAALLKPAAGAPASLDPDEEVVPLGAANAAAASAAAPAKPAAAEAVEEEDDDEAVALAEVLKPAGAKPPAPAAEDAAAARAEAEKVAVLRAELAERERALAERERVASEREVEFRDGAQRFADDPVGLLTSYVRATLPAGASEEQVRAAFADYVMELSFVAGGISPPEDEVERRTTRREINKLKREREREAAARAEAEAAARKAREEAAAAEAESARQRRGLETVKQSMGDVAAKYPYLAAGANPHELVWNYVDRHYQRTGEVLDLDRAAKFIDRTLEEEIDAVGSRYYDLLSRKRTPATPAAPAKAASTPPAAHQGDHQDRSSATEGARQPPAETTPQTPEEFIASRRARTLSKYKALA